jgi:phage-related protein
MTDFPSIAIAQNSKKTRKNRVLVAQFGGGYGQYARDGLNSFYDEWNIVLSNLTSTQRTTVNTFYETIGSDQWFNWTAPGDSVVKKWRISKDTFMETTQGGQIYTISMTIVQQFDIG